MENNNFQININQAVFGMQYENMPHQFVRSVSPYLPKSRIPFNKEKLPPFLHFRPLPPNVEPTKINCRRGDCPRCSTCKAYLSPFVQVDVKHRCWKCPMCHRINSTIHFTSLYDMNVDVVDRPEMHNMVYDILPPREMYMTRGKARSYVIMIDSEMLNDANREKTLKMIDFCQFDDNDIVYLITFSGSVSIYDIENSKVHAFPEFDPELLISKVKGVNAKQNFEKIKICIESACNSRERCVCNIVDALKWACNITEGVGGKIIMITSGKFDVPDILQDLQKCVLSLNVFLLAHNKSIENLASHTGGHCFMLDNSNSQDSQMLSLFTFPTAWDAATSFRCTTDMAKLLKIEGNCGIIEKVCARSPVIDQSSALTFIIEVDSAKACGDFVFQFAFRFTNDKGERIIRIVNGKMPFADFIPQPLDEASLALFYLRHYFGENNITNFNNNVASSKSHVLCNTPDSLYPQLLYAGLKQDSNFILTTTVENFVLSILETEVVLNGKSFNVCWRPGYTTVTPALTQDDICLLEVAAKTLGVPFLKIVQQAEKVADPASASIWYGSL